MNERIAVLAAMCGLLFASTAIADEDDNPDWSKQQQQAAGSSGLGESCRRKTDCKEGLKCVRRVCTDPHEGETCGATADCGGGELKCIADKCTSPNAPASTTAKPTKPPPPEGDDAGDAAKPVAQAPPSGDWLKFRVDDGQMHPFIGITSLFGFGLVGLDALGTTAFGSVTPALLFALKAGVIVGGRHELGVELTPFFTVLSGAGSLGPVGASGPAFEINASYGYLIPIMDHLSWPLRVGAGLLAGPSPNAGDNAWFEVRADLVGVQVNVGHLLVDVQLPSFRYFVTNVNGVTGHVLNWVFGLSLGYAL